MLEPSQKTVGIFGALDCRNSLSLYVGQIGAHPLGLNQLAWKIELNLRTELFVREQSTTAADGVLATGYVQYSMGVINSSSAYIIIQIATTANQMDLCMNVLRVIAGLRSTEDHDCM